jgi:hypothetical protein
MELVESWEDIKKNLITLEQYRNSPLDDVRHFYLGLIKRGVCFVIYEHDGKLILGPSRFVGYLNNNMYAHLANEYKDGRETNPSITKILDRPPKENKDLEEVYRGFCKHLGIEPSGTGSFGVRRKYWLKRS